MDTSSGLKADDYLQQYRNISAKLKKRFLRKPNVAVASEEFGSLQRALADSEVWAGAGLCCIAVARCHQTLANARAEAQAITQAARYYAKAEQASLSILCPSFGEHLSSASSCYRRAIALHSAAQTPSAAGTASAVSSATDGAIQRAQSPSQQQQQLGSPLHSGSGVSIFGSTFGSGGSSSSTTTAAIGGVGTSVTSAGAAQDASASVLRDQQPCDSLLVGANTTAAALSLELAKTLQACDRCSEALPPLHAAADLLAGCPVQQLHVMQQLQQCYLLLGDLDGALKTCVRMMAVVWEQQEEPPQLLGVLPKQQEVLPQQLQQGSLAITAGFRDVLSSCEVSSLLLLLLLQPLPQRTPASLQQVLLKYSPHHGSAKDMAPFSNRSLLCLLRCLTLAVRAKDKAAVEELAVHLTPLLHHLPYHLHLLHLLLLEVNRG